MDRDSWFVRYFETFVHLPSILSFTVLWKTFHIFAHTGCWKPNQLELKASLSFAFRLMSWLVVFWVSSSVVRGAKSICEKPTEICLKSIEEKNSSRSGSLFFFKSHIRARATEKSKFETPPSWCFGKFFADIIWRGQQRRISPHYVKIFLKKTKQTCAKGLFNPKFSTTRFTYFLVVSGWCQCK